MNRTQRLLRLSAWTLGAATLLAAPALHAQDAPPAVDPAQFSACLNELKAAPAFSRITPATFVRATEGLQADPSVLVLRYLKRRYSVGVKAAEL